LLSSKRCKCALLIRRHWQQSVRRGGELRTSLRAAPAERSESALLSFDALHVLRREGLSISTLNLSSNSVNLSPAGGSRDAAGSPGGGQQPDHSFMHRFAGCTGRCSDT
jgi:hypothetical protein